MDAFFYRIQISVALILVLSFSSGLAADKKQYFTSPPPQISKKWRIGYYEGGPYHNYPKTLIAIVNGLAEFGWLEPISIPFTEGDKTTDKLWAWLAANIKSRYIEFVPDAHYSYHWKKELREQTKQIILKRLNETKDIHLMIAMGTWAGKDLANNEHSVPTLICSVSDPINAKIIKSAEDSGYDHVHAHVDPARYIKQVRAFYDVIKFKKLGMMFHDTVEGRSYSAIESVRKLAKEYNFEIIECHTLPGEVTPESQASAVKCAQELAKKIDALYITQQTSVNKETLPQIIAAMNANKIPTFSQAGPDEVRRGVLLSVATPDFKLWGKFHAGVIAKIINGAKPRELNQIFELPIKSAFNAAEAKIIGLKPEIYDLLLRSSVEVYKEIDMNK